MNAFAVLSKADRSAVFKETAAKMGIGSALMIEKDFWVCWVLFRMACLKELAPFVFKGGTSLSKAYGLIQRFSEDIDLTIDRRHLGFTGERDPLNAPSNKKAEKLVE